MCIYVCECVRVILIRRGLQIVQILVVDIDLLNNCMKEFDV